LQGNAVVRLVLAIVLVAALFHALNGLRITFTAMAPRAARHDQGLRSWVQFLTFAVGIPAAFVVCWPSISELFR
jgi:succinate dehydrogenase/fumarate reductase cytochrome b subunit